MNPIDHWGIYNLQTIRVYAETPRLNSRQRPQRTPVNRIFGHFIFITECETHAHRGRVRASQRINNNRASRQNDQRASHPILEPIPLVINPSNIGASQQQIHTLSTSKIEEKDELDDCSICLSNYEVGQEYIRLHCGHTYHKECIEQWLKLNPICPQDRIHVFI